MTSWKKPTDLQVDRAVALMMGRWEKYHYFFERLDNPEWVAPLRSRRFFRNPPGPVEKDDQISFPVWPESRYLSRVAAEAPDLVLEIIKDMPATKNFRVHQDLLEAASKMPPDKGAQIVPLVELWLENEYVGLLPDYAGQFLAFLANGGETKAALLLLEALTEPVAVERPTWLRAQEPLTWREVRSQYSPWHLRRLIQEMLPEVFRLDPVGVAAVLESQLRKSIALEGAELPGGDGSYLWRRAIEDHDQNWAGDDIKSILTGGLRDALEGVAQDQADVLQEVIERYLKDNLSIFRRLALHLIRVGGDHYNALAAQAVRDPVLRDDPPVHHEYYRLLEDRFAKLPETVREEYLEWVDTGPDVEDFKKWAEQVAGQQPSDEDIQLHTQRWQLEQLTPLRHALPAKWRQRYERLVAKYGEPEHPEFLIWSSTTWVGPATPKKKEELREIGPADTIQYLITFEPSGEPFEDSRAGLGRELQAAVQEDPAGYLPVANKFLERQVHPTYVYHLVTGLHEAWKKGTDLDWRLVLDFFGPVSMAVTGEGPPPAEHTIGVDDTGWVGVRMAVSRFLSGALARDDRPLPSEVMPTIRDTLLRLIRDRDPTRENEQERFGGAMDWVSIRINTARGVAASALLEYALRYARMHKAKDEALAAEKGDVQRMEPSVKTAFTEMLDREKEPSAAVHSLFGQFLPNFLFLDRQWIVSQLDGIFPPEAENERYWEAAWEGYMLYCPRVYRELYELLQPQYHRAVAALPGADTSTPIRSTAHALAQHIALSYRMGYEDLEPPPDSTRTAPPDGDSRASLLNAFLELASDELRAAFVRGLGSSLGVEDDLQPEHWSRMRNYWEARTESVPYAPSGYEMDKELSAFVSWLQGVPEGLDALGPLLRVSIERLATGHDAHELLEYLSDQSQSHPRLATELLRLLLDREAALARGPDVNRIYLIGAEQYMRTILENAMGADNAARESAVSLINLLGERGDYTYRQLLQPHD
ncbi:MAG TPA: hypothetical protein VMW58_00320 [Anaerolineae bacterium]|nr:hypothetical protein [Anaerolineae bacterium]